MAPGPQSQKPRWRAGASRQAGLATAAENQAPAVERLAASAHDLSILVWDDERLVCETRKPGG